MMVRALLVPRTRGESARRALISAGLLRPNVPILREGEFLAIPMLDGAAPPTDLGFVVEREIPVRPDRPPTDYRELVHLPPAEATLLPRSFDVVGDIVLVRVPPELEGSAREIGRALLDFVPGARLVGADHGVHGAERRRSLEVLAGSGSWRTRHRENGLSIEVDLELAYFSPRLAREHARVADEVGRGERVYDLCCGVGPFSLTVASQGRASRVTAVDSNPRGLELLRASIARLRATVPVEVIATSVEEFSPSANPVERVILNLPLEGIKYLPSVARTVTPGGHLHYYEVVPRSELDRRGEAVVRALGSPVEWRVQRRHIVHPYSPVADLVGFDLEHLSASGGAV